jgi:5-methylcytosine-specific restriction protein B
MSEERLASILRQIYMSAARADTSVAVILFGIRYADMIDASGIRPRELARLAGIPESYASDLKKGIRLASHVVLKGRTA